MSVLRPIALPVLLAAAAAAAVAFGAAGCKSGDSPAAAPTPAATVATSAAASPTAQPATSSAATTGTALATLPAACPTAAVVSSTLGISVSTPSQNHTATTLDCVYLGKPAADSLTINFTTAKKLTPAQALAALKAQGTSAKFTEVPGVGDEAYYDAPPTGGSYIVVLSGDLAFHIVDGGVVAAANMKALAQTILAG